MKTRIFGGIFARIFVPLSGDVTRTRDGGKASLPGHRSGNVTIFFAASLAALLGTGALAVDAGRIFFEKRRLQGVADAAALSAASDLTRAETFARSTVVANQRPATDLAGVALGAYTARPEAPASTRFVRGASGANAVEVTLAADVPTFFARGIGGARTVRVEAHALAARIDLAALSVGSRLASLDGGIANQILSGLAGTDLRLTVADYNGLVGAEIDLLRFSEALRTELDLDVATFGDVLNARATLPQLLRAIANASPDPITTATLRRIAQLLPLTEIVPARLIDLGPLGSNTGSDPHRPVKVDAYSLLRAILEFGGTRQIAANVDAGLPGLAGVNLRIAIGERPVNTPWLAIGPSGSVTVRTAQARVWLDVNVGSALPANLVSLRVPVFAELASAEARLTQLNCAAASGSPIARASVTPGVGSLGVADIDLANFNDFSRALAPRDASLVRVPLLFEIKGRAAVALQSGAQSVSFTKADVDNRVPKSVSTHNLTGSLATSLVQNTSLTPVLLGLPLPLTPITTAVGNTLTLVAPALDLLLDQVLTLAGLKVGEADVWINGVRCGTPQLVG